MSLRKAQRIAVQRSASKASVAHELDVLRQS